MTKNITQKKLACISQPCLKNIKVLHNHAHFIIGLLRKKMSSNAINLGLNVESALPTIHMHLYLNYKHKPNILTYLYKKYAHEIIKQGEKSN